MNISVLQVPVDKNLRERAASVARKMGFSSLQETVRVFLARLASGEINVKFEPRASRLSPKNEKRYNQMIKDIESGRVKAQTFSSVDTLLDFLAK